MFKRLSLFFLVVLTAVFFVGCDKDTDENVDTPTERTYVADGVYTAFKWDTSSNAQQLTWVSVTIKDDKVVSYYIDTLQGKVTKDESGKATGANFNAKTKKELKYEYGMHKPSSNTSTIEEYQEYLKNNNLLEWFEQAKLIEDFFLEKGPENLEKDDKGYIKNVAAGVTIKDSHYSDLAKEALDNAKKGIAKEFYVSGNDIIFVTAKVNNESKFTELTLDTIQGKFNGETGTWVWNEKTKQELKEAYGMKGKGAKYEFKDGAWSTVPDAKCEKEWYEQAKIITDYVLANGIEGLRSINGQGISKDGATLIDAGVTVKTDAYIEVLKKLYNNFKK